MAGRNIQIAMLAALAAAGCAEKVDGVPSYAIGECRRVTLIDQESGKAIVGAEDLAYDAAMRRVLISAYDRRKVEQQANARAPDIEQGGIYAAPIKELEGKDLTLTLSSIVARDTVAGGLRPHGVGFDANRREITFVNRSYQMMGRKWSMSPRIERAGADGAVFVGDGGRPRCSANDVVTMGDQTFVSFDHASCGWRGGLEDLFASRKSGIDGLDGADLFNGAGHANGVVATQDNRLALAATRDNALLVLDAEGDRFRVEKSISLPGAPDNLTKEAGGAIVTAVYPSLMAIGAQRKFGLGRSGSRIVRVNIETGAVTLLFDDPDARLISAASAAIEEEGVLVIGSALDRGIVVCQRSDAAS